MSFTTKVATTDALVKIASTMALIEAAIPIKGAPTPASRNAMLKPGQMIDPNSSLANAEHAKSRGQFAMSMITSYSSLPGIDQAEFEQTAKELLSAFETHDSFPKTFARIVGNLSGATEPTSRDDKKYQLSLILGSAVAAAIVMVAGAGQSAPTLVSRLFNKQGSADTASRIAQQIDTGDPKSLDQSLEPIIDKTILKILGTLKGASDPFIKDGVERFERLVGKKGKATTNADVPAPEAEDDAAE